MQSFKDKNGKNWDIELKIGTAIKLKSRFGLDVDQVLMPDDKSNTSAIEKITTDIEYLFNIIYTFCEKQCREAAISQEDFAELFDAAAIDSAINAFLEEIINFSRPAKKKILQEMNRIRKDVQKKAGEKVEKIISSQEFRDEIEKALTNSFLNVQES